MSSSIRASRVFNGLGWAGTYRRVAALGECVEIASLKRFDVLFLLVFNFHIAEIAPISGLSADSSRPRGKSISFGSFMEAIFSGK